MIHHSRYSIASTKLQCSTKAEPVLVPEGSSDCNEFAGIKNRHVNPTPATMLNAPGIYHNSSDSYLQEQCYEKNLFQII